MRKILSVLAIVWLASVASAEQTKTIFNPFTGKSDYITSMSTNNITAGSGVTISCTGGSCTISSSGSGSSVSVPVFSVLYSTTGTSITGSSSFQFNGSSASLFTPLTISATTQANIIQVSSTATGVQLVSVSSTPASASTDFLLTVSSTNGTVGFGVQNNSHVISSGTTPSMGSCGTSPAVNGTDFAGVVTVGGGVVTSCAVNFAYPFLVAPVCVLASNSTSVAADISSVSTTAVTFGFSATLGGGTVWYLCVGNKG